MILLNSYILLIIIIIYHYNYINNGISIGGSNILTYFVRSTHWIENIEGSKKSIGPASSGFEFTHCIKRFALKQGHR